MKFIRLLVPFFLSLSVQAQQELPRRAFFGIQMESVTDDVKRVMQLPAAKGVLVNRVIPGSTAEAAGLQRGDVLLELGGQEINTPDEAVARVRDYRAGQEMAYKIIRKGETRMEKTTIQGLPKEQYADLDVSYGVVQVGDATLRTIFTKPKKSGKLPALLFIQGIGCYSVDAPFDTLRADVQLVNRLARQGFAVMRVDKSGLGDSRGTPCEQIDFMTELASYKKAFEAMQQSAAVDASNCFIYGHSMGGVMAPMVARELPVKGIVVYGTIGVNFMEYFTHTRRSIAQSEEMNPAEADSYIKEQCQCASMLLSARLSREEAVKRNPACGEAYDFLLLRDKTFWYQLDELNIPSAWQQYNGKVLALWGNADYLTTRAEHEYIAQTVNRRHPGYGTFMEIDKSSHDLHVASGYVEARVNPGPFNPAAVDKTGEWLKKQVTEKIEATPWGTKERATQVVWMDGVENAYPRWSKNGDRILFQSNRSGKWQLYLVNNDGTGLQQITTDAFNNNFPDWSADNRQVSFVSDRDGNEEIYVMNIDGSNLRRLTNHPARDIHPYFAPDGKSLLFNSSRDDANSFDVYQIDLSGKNQKRITSTPDVETCARFSPDGKKILCLKGLSGSGIDDIFVLNPDGSNPVNLTNTPEREGWPAWSPDGSKILFSSMRGGNYCLYEMDPDGGNVRQISFAEPSKEDARAGYAGSGERVLFNRQVRGTIGIFILERRNG